MRLKTLGSHNIRQKVGACSEPGRMKGDNVRVILPPIPAHGNFGLGPSGPHSRSVGNFLHPLFPS